MRGELIHIEQLEAFGHVGVTEAERAKPQRLTFNLDLFLPHDFEHLSDDISQTVNYSAVAGAVREFVREHPFALIETLNGQLADELLARFPLAEVKLEIRKYVLPDAAYVSTTVIRSRS